MERDVSKGGDKSLLTCLLASPPYHLEERDLGERASAMRRGSAVDGIEAWPTTMDRPRSGAEVPESMIGSPRSKGDHD